MPDKLTIETDDNTVRIEHASNIGTQRYTIEVDAHGVLTIDGVYLGRNGTSDGKEILCVGAHANQHQFRMWIG